MKYEGIFVEGHRSKARRHKLVHTGDCKKNFICTMPFTQLYQVTYLKNIEIMVNMNKKTISVHEQKV